MASLTSGLRSIEVDDGVPCPECGHTNHVIECIVRGWQHEMEAGETELQFVSRFFDWNEDSGSGEVECRCGQLIQWTSPEGTMDVVLDQAG